MIEPAPHPSASAAEVWDDTYRPAPKWSGRPNVFLVPLIDAAPVGARALDIGCGEGADAIWLAGLGWNVLAVDVSEVALGRAREHAAAQGVAVRFEQADLEASFPAGTFELVTASYLHSTIAFARERILRRAWQAVAPGGRLVILSHADVPTGMHAHGHTELPGAAETLALLQLPAEASWSAMTYYRSRMQEFPDGSSHVRTDHVVIVSRA